MQPQLIIQLVMLLGLANGTPVVAKKIFGRRFAQPLDGNAEFLDGRPIFGHSKTIRGVLLAVLVSTLGALLIGTGWEIGLVVGGLAMIGDLTSSFVKRRLNLPPSSRASGLDQIPEALFPLLGCRELLPLTIADIGAGLALFAIGDVVLSRLLYKVHLRDRPY